MNWGSALFAGLVATGVMTLLMTMGKRMGMPMDLPKLLGAIFVDPASSAASRIGLVIHFMMGLVFAIVYAALFNILDARSFLLWRVRLIPHLHRFAGLRNQAVRNTIEYTHNQQAATLLLRELLNQ